MLIFSSVGRGHGSAQSLPPTVNGGSFAARQSSAKVRAIITAASLLAGVCRAAPGSLPLTITDRTLPSVDRWDNYTSGVTLLTVVETRSSTASCTSERKICRKSQFTKIRTTKKQHIFSIISSGVIRPARTSAANIYLFPMK